jgi:hypothetical protein
MTRTRTWIVGTGILTLALALGVIDWATGHELDVFVFYFLPVSIAAWYLGLCAAVAAAVGCALIWFVADYAAGHTYSSHLLAAWNTLILLSSFMVMAWLVHKVRSLVVSEREKVAALREASAQVKVLQGFLPICAQCKKIRNEDGAWEQMEVYISKRSEALFSHGYCPDCARKALEEAGLGDERPDQ